MARLTIPGLDAEFKKLEDANGEIQKKIESLEKRVKTLEGASQEDKKPKKDKWGE